jgi:osmotically inducible lipoprotein OsmB
VELFVREKVTDGNRRQLMKFARQIGIACILAGASASAAYADDCSGRDHTAGTVIGAAGGAAIGGAASHNAGGAIAGAVVGGLAGNAIARAQDCNRNDYRESRQSSGYYGPAYAVAPDENDYWGVESYDDFTADYRHIQFSIDRARERGSLRPDEARRFSRELQQIQYQADRQQRRGRFDPQEIEERLGQLREEMRSARRDNREERANYNGR